MIQRIQTVYLILCSMLCIACMSLPVARFAGAEGTIRMYNLFLSSSQGGHQFTPWALFAILCLVATLSALNVFLFRRRALQMRVAVLSMILLVGYYLVYGVFAYLLGVQYGEAGLAYAPHWAVSLPFAALVLEYLAFRGILKDELLVKSLDRLR